MALIRVLLNLLLLTHSTLSQPVKGSANFVSHQCAPPFYGRPDPTHCKDLLDYVFPDTSPSRTYPTFNDPRARIFDNEEVRANADNSGWPGSIRLPLTDIVQLPKHYTRRSCNLAIYPYHEPNVSRGYGNVIGSWEAVRLGAGVLVIDCVLKKQNGNGGGEFYVFSPTQRFPVLTVFIWATGARDFEDRLNKYESDPRTILQVGSHWTWDIAGATNITSFADGDGTLALGSPAVTSGTNFTVDGLGLDVIDWNMGAANVTQVDGAAIVRQNTTADGSPYVRPIVGNLPGGSEGAGTVTTF